MVASGSPLLIISGLSGSGKTVALNALEDLSYYCIDNLPGGLLPDLLDEIRRQPDRYPKVAIGIDARTGPDGLERLQNLFDRMPDDEQFKLLFLEADKPVLIRRFSETRRRHPLASMGSLEEAIAHERKLMARIRKRADWVINTSESNIHQLRRQVWRSVGGGDAQNVQSVVLESFAFKRGVPRDVDLMFDARCLPNPHWEPELRPRTGLDPEVQKFLQASERVQAFTEEVFGMVLRWLPAYFEDQRSLLTVAIGCTGGQHRSVYLVDLFGRRLREQGQPVIISHRELDR
jgi:RNase adapter protein RapZ